MFTKRSSFSIDRLFQKPQWRSPLAWLMGVLVLTILIYGLLLIFPPKALVPIGGWQAQGHFKLNGHFPSDETQLNLTRKRFDDLQLWGSWDGKGTHRGRLQTVPFQMPAGIHFYVSGYPPGTGQHVRLVNLDTGQKENISMGWARENWVRVRINAPAGWKGDQVRLEAEDRGGNHNGWIGISTIFVHDWRMQIAELWTLPIFCASLFLWIVPTLIIAGFLINRNWTHPSLALLMGILGMCLIGYGIFWVYFFSAVIGKITSIAIMIASCAMVIQPKTNAGLNATLANPEVTRPLLILFCTGLFYTLLLYMYYLRGSIQTYANFRFLSWMLPGDNSLPLRLAEILYSKLPLHPFFFEWLSSDRPPLQSGIFLLQRSISDLWLNVPLHYQSIGMILQLTWIPAMWSLGRSMALKNRQIYILLGFCIFSGFFTIHSLFPWPKMIAAALVIGAYILLIGEPGLAQKPSLKNIIMAAVSAGLALLSHGGAIFTLLAIALMLLHPKRFPGIKHCSLSILIVVALMAPWWAYQKYVDPPGNRLIKWHLAGIDYVDNRSTWETIKQQYARLNITEYLYNKEKNLKQLFGRMNPRLLKLNRPAAEVRKSKSYEHVFHCLGLLNLGWLMGIVVLFKTYRRKALFGLFPHHLKNVLLTGCLGLLIWVILMYKAGGTVLQQGSHATMMLLFAGLGALLCRYKWVAYPLWGIDLCFFFIHWVAISPRHGQLNLTVVPFLALSAMSLIGVLIHLAADTKSSSLC